MTLLRLDGKLIDVEESLRELDRVEYEESLGAFLRTGWRYIDPAPFIDGWVIDALAEHLQAVCDGDIRDLLINIPPRSLKSTMCSVVFPAWVWAQRFESHTSGPGVKFLHGSYADKLSVRDSVHCRRLIESPWYQDLWGSRYRLSGDQNAKHRFSNDKGGERLITSIGAGVTGEGGNIIVIDDANASKDMEKLRAAAPEEVIEWWDGTMPTRRNDPKRSARLVIQQRLAENDLSGHILSKNVGNWVHLCLPMEYEASRSFETVIGWSDPRSEEGELLWPERMGSPEVIELKRELGKWRSAGQLQQRPEPKGGGIIQRDWWQTWTADKYPPFSYIVASLDTAYTEKTENDPSAMTVWGIFSSDTVAQPSPQTRGAEPNWTIAQQAPKAMLMHAWADRLEIHKLVTKVAKTCKTMKVDRLLIESKASGISVAQEIRRLHSNENWAVQLVDPKGQDKVARTHSVAPLWEAGLVWAPDRSWADETITEMANFPKGTHDDRHDTATQALRHLRDLGLLQMVDEVRAAVADSTRHTGKPEAPLYPS